LGARPHKSEKIGLTLLVMKIHQGLHHSLHIPNPIVTTGTFDGVHVGHRKIIERLKNLAQDNQGETVVITFEPHPRLVLFPEDSGLVLLSTMEEKQALLREAGIDHLIIVPFTREFSRQSSKEWIYSLQHHLLLHTLVIGYDHHFGRNREGSIEQLHIFSQELGFQLEEIPAQDIDDIRVSSTKIRQAIGEGDIRSANNFLKSPYSFTGLVVQGDQRGRQIGYPTANLQIHDPLKLIPADGVYAVNVRIDNKMFQGMLNIGVRPTVDGKKHTLEVHIFHLEQNLYGKNITLQLMSRIRSEKKFDSIDALKMQLDQDAQVAMNELNEV
jgi:riboflavin kinase/FMN adenylyltransferase